MATSSHQSHSVLDTHTHTLPSALAAMGAAYTLLMLARPLHTRPVPPVMVGHRIQS